jgi:peptidoglycan/LPS O-acetylase OafA/YrhL
MNDISRVKSLDSIRGIAALAVLFNHCYILSDVVKAQIHQGIDKLGEPFSSILTLLVKLSTAGTSAVILFFILSGFVLTLSLINHKSTYKHFIIKRFFRLYPVLFISIIISYFLHYFIGSGDGTQFSDWYRTFISPPINLSTDNLLNHLIPIILSIEHVYLDMPIWSLAYEIRISILFPFIVLLCMKYNRIFFSSLLLIAAGITYFILDKNGINVRNALQETATSRFIITGYFSIFFLIGISLALRYDTMRSFTKTLSPTIKILLIITALLLMINNMQAVLFDYLCGAGATIIIILAFSWDGFARTLTSKPLLWLGRISYSLYFVHCIVLYAVCSLFGSSLNIWYIIAIIITASLLCAELMARFIEYPFINLGKKLLHKNK